MLTAPYDHPLNLTMQAILTYGSWSLTLVVLAIAVRMGLKEKTPFYVYVVLAAMVGAFAEPLYDEGLMLLRHGARAYIYIPYDQAYGENGQGPVPPQADLVFYVEIL